MLTNCSFAADGTPEAEDVQPKKKAKIAESTSTKRKGRVGKLQYFKEMPLDIFYEICGHLDPLTLLYLARTCKNLRSMFMSKRAVGIWEETLANVSFPPLAAKDTSLPMYASLAFEIHCHVNIPSLSYQILADPILLSSLSLLAGMWRWRGSR